MAVNALGDSFVSSSAMQAINSHHHHHHHITSQDHSPAMTSGPWAPSSSNYQQHQQHQQPQINHQSQQQQPQQISQQVDHPHRHHHTQQAEMLRRKSSETRHLQQQQSMAISQDMSSRNPLGHTADILRLEQAMERNGKRVAAQISALSVQIASLSSVVSDLLQAQRRSTGAVTDGQVTPALDRDDGSNPWPQANESVAGPSRLAQTISPLPPSQQYDQYQQTEQVSQYRRDSEVGHPDQSYEQYQQPEQVAQYRRESEVGHPFAFDPSSSSRPVPAPSNQSGYEMMQQGSGPYADQSSAQHAFIHQQQQQQQQQHPPASMESHYGHATQYFPEPPQTAVSVIEASGEPFYTGGTAVQNEGFVPGQDTVPNEYSGSTSGPGAHFDQNVTGSSSHQDSANGNQYPSVSLRRAPEGESFYSSVRPFTAIDHARPAPTQPPNVGGHQPGQAAAFAMPVSFGAAGINGEAHQNTFHQQQQQQADSVRHRPQMEDGHSSGYPSQNVVFANDRIQDPNGHFGDSGVMGPPAPRPLGYQASPSANRSTDVHPELQAAAAESTQYLSSPASSASHRFPLSSGQLSKSQQSQPPSYPFESPPGVSRMPESSRRLSFSAASSPLANSKRSDQMMDGSLASPGGAKRRAIDGAGTHWSGHGHTSGSSHRGEGLSPPGASLGFANARAIAQMASDSPGQNNSRSALFSPHASFPGPSGSLSPSAPGPIGDVKYWYENPPSIDPAVLAQFPLPRYPTLQSARLDLQRKTGRTMAKLGRLPLKDYLEVSPAEYLSARKTGRSAYNEWLVPLVRLAKQEPVRVKACCNFIEYTHPLLSLCDGQFKSRQLLQQIIDNAIDESKIVKKRGATNPTTSVGGGHANGSVTGGNGGLGGGGGSSGIAGDGQFGDAVEGDALPSARSTRTNSTSSSQSHSHSHSHSQSHSHGRSHGRRSLTASSLSEDSPRDGGIGEAVHNSRVHHSTSTSDEAKTALRSELLERDHRRQDVGLSPSSSSAPSPPFSGDAVEGSVVAGREDHSSGMARPLRNGAIDEKEEEEEDKEPTQRRIHGLNLSSSQSHLERSSSAQTFSSSREASRDASGTSTRSAAVVTNGVVGQSQTDRRRPDSSAGPVAASA